MHNDQHERCVVFVVVPKNKSKYPKKKANKHEKNLFWSYDESQPKRSFKKPCVWESPQLLRPTD